MNEPKNYDFIDLVTGVIGVCFIAANISVTPLWTLPTFLIWFGIKIARRTQGFENWIDSVSEVHPLLTTTMPYLLPPPNDDQEIELPITPTKKALIAGEPSKTRRLAAIAPQDDKKTTAQNMNAALARMPKILPYNHAKIPDPPTPTSVLVGYDSEHRKMLWADFGKYNGDTIHAFVAGQVGSGKDSMLRLWFSQLTQNNDPSEAQFIIIDAKGEWITPSLKDSAHMFTSPVGGFDLKIESGSTGRRKLVDKANEAIEDALIDAVDMLQARADSFQKAGATNIQAYERKTGKKLPLLFIIATDVGTNLEGILEQLVRFVVLKGRSLGVRMIISLQSASGENTSWRGQIGLVLSGYQGLASADAPNIGIPVKAMKYRPSELPNVDLPANRGLFVVRKGLDQYVVRGAYIPDDIFEDYCERSLPKKSYNDLLGSLLLTMPEKREIAVVQPPQYTLTKEQSLAVARYTMQHFSPATITKMLGFTSGKRYDDMLPLITNIHNAVLVRMRSKQQ